MLFQKLPKALQGYILAHFLLLAPALWPVLQQNRVSSVPVFLALLAGTAVAGSWKLELTVFQARMSVVFAMACLALLLEGGSAAVTCSALGALVTTVVRTPQGWRVKLQQQPLHRLLFNPAHCALVCSLAVLAHQAALPYAPGGWWGRACGLIVFTTVYFLANSYGIAVAIGLQQGRSAPRLWVENFLWTSPGFYASALATAVIWGVFKLLGPWALLLAAPLYLIHHSARLYLQRLEAANVSLQEQVAERMRAEAALMQEREFLQAVLENAADGIVAADASGSVTHLNSAARALMGAADPEKLALSGPLASALSGKPMRRVEITLSSGSDDERHALASAQPIQDVEGRPLGAVLVLNDVTEQRRVAEARERLIREQVARTVAEEGRRRLAFLAKAGEILASSLDYETTLANVARLSVPYLARTCVIDMLQDDGGLRRLVAVQAEGRAPLQDVGQYGVGGLDRAHPVRRAFETGQTQRGRGLPESPPGAGSVDSAPWAAYLCCPLMARGSILGAVSFLAEEMGEDFDAHEVAVAEELAHRAAQAVDNARLYGEVQEHDRRKDVFLAMLGHELRNPLAAMVSSLEVMRLRGAWDGPNAHALNVLFRQTKHQARLVEDLLDVSRITQGRVLLRMDHVDLAELVAQAVESARPLVESCRHRLILSVPARPVWLEADATRLEQVVVNLINNAAKYTNPGGEISVSVETPTDGWSVVRVRDNGIGMSQDLLRRVFEVFTQAADARERAQGGLGLGLSLVRGLVQQHGGRVEAYSDGDGRGSELVVHLPLVSSTVVEPSAPVSANPLPARVHTLRVLVVDDNRDAAEMTVEVLELWGFAASVAHSGIAALRSVDQRMPDVVLLDIGMPGLDGYAVARELRARPDGGPRCIIAVTGYGQAGDVQRALAAGMDAHLTKPVDLDALRRLLEGAEGPPPTDSNLPISPFSWPSRSAP